MPQVVPSLSGIHVPTGDDPNQPLSLGLEDKDEKSSRPRSAEGGVMPPPRLTDQRSHRENLLGLFCFDAVAQSSDGRVAGADP